MKQRVEKLYQLQKQDDRIKEKKNTIQAIPREIQSLESERDQKSEIINQSNRKLDANTGERMELEKKILGIKEKIQKYKDQMQNATTNKEYQGFQNEIKFQEDSIQDLEDHIIEKMLESDEIMEEVGRAEAEFQAIASDYDHKIEDLKKELGKNNQELEVLLQEREQLIQDIPKDLFKVYDSLFKKKYGKVISPVESDHCGVCFVKIRPQLLNELITTDQLFFCENCGRILYKIYPEEKANGQTPPQSK